MEGNSFLTEHDQNPLFWIRDAKRELKEILNNFRGEITVSNVQNSQHKINDISKGLTHTVDYLIEIAQINKAMLDMFSDVKTAIVKTYKKINEKSEKMTKVHNASGETGMLCYSNVNINLNKINSSSKCKKDRQFDTLNLFKMKNICIIVSFLFFSQITPTCIAPTTMT